MPSNELRHYGVPGMKWGKRQASGSSSTPGQFRAGNSGGLRRSVSRGAANVPKAHQMAKDQRLSKRVKSVNPNIEKSTIQKLVAKEKLNGKDKRALAGLAFGVAMMAAPQILNAMDSGMGSLASAANAKNAARGATAARNLFADNKGIASYTTVALKMGANGRFG